MLDLSLFVMSLKKEIVLKYVNTNQQIADIFTKALSHEKFKKFRDLIMY